MAFDGSNLVVCDRHHGARDTVVGAWVRRWKAPRRTCTGIFLRFEHVDIPLIRHSSKMEYVRRLSDLFQKDAITGTLDLRVSVGEMRLKAITWCKMLKSVSEI